MQQARQNDTEFLQVQSYGTAITVMTAYPPSDLGLDGLQDLSSRFG